MEHFSVDFDVSNAQKEKTEAIFGPRVPGSAFPALSSRSVQSTRLVCDVGLIFQQWGGVWVVDVRGKGCGGLTEVGYIRVQPRHYASPATSLERKQAFPTVYSHSRFSIFPFLNKNRTMHHNVIAIDFCLSVVARKYPLYI